MLSISIFISWSQYLLRIISFVLLISRWPWLCGMSIVFFRGDLGGIIFSPRSTIPFASYRCWDRNIDASLYLYSNSWFKLLVSVFEALDLYWFLREPRWVQWRDLSLWLLPRVVPEVTLLFLAMGVRTYSLSCSFSGYVIMVNSGLGIFMLFWNREYTSVNFLSRILPLELLAQFGSSESQSYCRSIFRFHLSHRTAASLLLLDSWNGRIFRCLLTFIAVTDACCLQHRLNLTVTLSLRCLKLYLFSHFDTSRFPHSHRQMSSLESCAIYLLINYT